MSYIDEFLKFEHDNNLFEMEIQGIKFWHYIRFGVYGKIVEQKEDRGRAHTSLDGEKKSRRIFLKIKQIPDFILKNPLLFLKQKDLLIFNHQRRVKDGEVFKCIYTDDLLKEINATYYVYEQPHIEFHFKPVETDNLKYMDYITFSASVKKRVMSLFNKNKISSNEIKDIEEVILRLNNCFNLEMSSKDIIIRVQNIVYNYGIYREYVKKIIKKTKPKAILIVGSYAFIRLILAEVAKEYNIKVIELQHGIMGYYHVAYNFYTKMQLKKFPDYVFLFGQFWKDTTRLPLDDDKTIVTGFPYYESKKSKYQHNKQDETRKTILFISQGTIGGQLSKIASDLYHLLDQENYRIIYKLHPGEYDRWEKEYPWLKGVGIEVIDNNKHGIYYYFAQASYQVGVYSTAIYEGYGFGLTTIIIKLSGYLSMDYLYSNGYAKLCASAEDVASYLKSNQHNTNIEEIKDYFWKSDSINNIITEVDKIIQKKD